VEEGTWKMKGISSYGEKDKERLLWLKKWKDPFSESFLPIPSPNFVDAFGCSFLD